MTGAERAIAAIAAVVAACAHGGAGAPITNRGEPGPTSEVRAIDWQNRTYVLDELGPVTVKAGSAELSLSDDHKAVESGADTGSYRVAPPLFADVNGDGIEDAIISSVLGTGGTGQFSEIRIYTIRAAGIVELAAIPGGDRGDGGISRVALDGNAVIVDRNVLAEGDGVCCASGAQRERWVWRNGEMVEDVAARRARPR